MKAEFASLWQWLTDLAERHRGKVRIELINVSSFRGFYKSIRHWTQTYPTFIVNHREKYTGRDKDQLERILETCLRAS